MDDIKRFKDLFKQITPLYSALGDQIRQELYIAMISARSLSVGELTVGTKLSRPTVSFHLKVLREAGLVASTKHGRKVYYRVTPGRYTSIMQQLIDLTNESTREHQ